MAIRRPGATGRDGPAHPQSSTAQPRKPRPVVYPESDGKPLAETELHLIELFRLYGTVRGRFAERPDVYVGSNLFLYYEEGNPRAAVSPDLMVVVGVPKLPIRRTFKVWEEGLPPTFVIEITSKKTRREDLGGKRETYARIGVVEYLLYDPLAEYLNPPLQGFRLAGGAYQPLPAEPDGALISAQLGLRLALVDGRLRLFDAATGAPLLSPEERAAAAAARAAAESARAAAAEAEVARLRALLAERQGGANGHQHPPATP